MTASATSALVTLDRDRAQLDHEVRSRLDRLGYAYLSVSPDSVSPDFDHVGFARRLGDPLPQYDGELIWEVRPDPALEDVYDSRNSRALVPHTEGYELPGTPPRYVALWCVRAAMGGGGETLIADGRPFLGRLSPEVRAGLATRRFRWRSSDGLHRQGIEFSAEHPALETRPEGTVMRFSENNVGSDDDGLLEHYLTQGRAWFDESRVAVGMAEGEMLIWDNWRMLHSRRAFGDARRHLRRMVLGG